MNRWVVFLDIEGTSKIFLDDEIRFFAAFDALLNALSCICSSVYPDLPFRLFAHKIGADGLLIVSEIAEEKPEVPISIDVVRMHVVQEHT